MTTNSISNNYNIEQTKKYQSVPAQKADKMPYGIMKTGQSATVEAGNRSNDKQEKTIDNRKEKLDKLLQKIVDKYQKYGITVNDLKNFAHIAKYYQMLEINTARKENRNTLKILEESLTQALDDCITADGIDLKKAEETSLKYKIALSTGLDIKDFKKEEQSESLIDLLIKKGYLDANATLDNTEPEVIKEAMEKAFLELLGEAKNNPSKKEVKEQLKMFGKLLANSSDKEKIYFGKAIKALHSQNKTDGIRLLFDSIRDTEQETAVADNMNISEITEGASKGDATKVAKEVTEKHSEKGRIESHKEVQEAHQNWFAKNKEIIDIINQKIREAEAKGIKPEFSEEEEKILADIERFTGIASGEIIGTVSNKNISEDFKSAHLKTLNEDAYMREDYREILSQTHNYIKEHREELLNLPENYETLLNKATNDNYTKVATGSNEKLSAPATTTASTKSEETTDTPAIGFTSRKPVEQTGVQALKEQYLQSTEKAPAFRVENTTRPDKKVLNVIEEFKTTNSAQKKLGIIKAFYRKSISLQNKLKEYVNRTANPLLILNQLPETVKVDLACKLIRNGKLKEEAICKLKISGSARNVLLNNLKEIEKEKNKNVQA